MKTLVLGLGKSIVRDDGLGPVVADRLARQVSVEVRTGPITGLQLLDCMTGYDKVIVVDATQSGDDRPGTIRCRELVSAGLAAKRTSPLPQSRHGWGIADLLALGSQAGLAVPRQVVVYTMEAGDLSDFGEGLTPAVAAAIPRMVRRIRGDQFSGPPGESTSTRRGEQCQTG